MKSRYILVVLVSFLIVFSCKKKSSTVTTVSVDPVAQAVIDNDSLVAYLQSHYLNTDGNIWTIENSERSLFEDVTTQDITLNDVSYKLYYLSQNEGTTISPTRSDSILVKYTGFLLDSTKFDSRILTWIDLTQVVQGWKYGFSHFKGGTKIINADESLSYINNGKGFLFFPSGLGFKDISASLIPTNSPLIFKIELNEVNRADHDNDGILSNLEDLDGDGEVANDDTDGDLIPNYKDSDDDGDTVKTRDEDVNGNGNVFDDDTDGDGIPNYLDNDDDGDGKLTKDEDANHNGDLTDDDTDGDGIPNYLDSDS
jgi:FKBP-type peptidyl-prolyl cis-trans isomerase